MLRGIVELIRRSAASCRRPPADAMSAPPCVSQSPPGGGPGVHDNRGIVGEFARIFYDERDVRRAFERYVAADYIQHNPNIADGREAAIEALTPLFTSPDFHVEIRHVIVDGNMAVLHLFARRTAAVRGGAVADIYRLQDGKIVEHWDVLQEIPERSANPHPMF
jgi:predicted SnoaL-like aldol condensation-catalyzing enzyme